MMEKEQPFFSIIVPTFGRPAQLATCLHSLACLDYPRDRFEVIVVDDGGQARSENLVAAFSRQMNLVLTPHPHGGPAKARNTGTRIAKGEFLAFTDDDCLPAADWLRDFAIRFRNNRNGMIGGRTLNGLPDNPYSMATHLIMDYLHQHYNSCSDNPRFFSTNNVAVPADLFHSLNGFDTNFPHAAGEDRDFCERWLHAGFQMTYAPEILVYHSHLLNFRGFWRKHLTYGKGAYRYHRARFQRGSGRFRPDPKFYIRLLSYPFVQRQGKKAPWLTILLMVSQVANAVGFLREGLSERKRRRNERSPIS